MHSRDQYYNPLVHAAKEGNLANVKDLLDPPWWKFWQTPLSAHGLIFGAIDELERDGTLLHVATFHNQFDIVSYLINYHFVDVNSDVRGLGTPFQLALKKGHTEIANLLSGFVPDPDPEIVV